MEETIIKTALTNGGISAILFVIWFFTVKYFAKQHEDTIKSNQVLIDKTLEQNREQFFKALVQNQDQHNTALLQNQNTLDKLFLVIQEDIKYKSLLHDTLVKLESKIEKQFENF